VAGRVGESSGRNLVGDGIVVIFGVSIGTAREGEPVRRFFARSGLIQYVSLLLFLAFSLLILYSAKFRILYSWDVVNYVAATYHDGDKSPEQVHRQTWQTVRDNVPQDVFLSLSAESDIRADKFADPDSHTSLLPMYRVKVGYVALLKLLSMAINPLQAMTYINAASVLLQLLSDTVRGGFEVPLSDHQVDYQVHHNPGDERRYHGAREPEHRNEENRRDDPRD
jgi:hypothetical protein